MFDFWQRAKPAPTPILVTELVREPVSEPAPSREDVIRSLVDPNGSILEIGPSYNGLFPRRLGYQAHILDHASGPDLRAKYVNEPNVDASLIEDVDFVWDGRSLPETVGAEGVYDYVVASHVIEHTPDLIGFLSDCSALLRPTGRLVLAVPDKRRCFDAFRPLTSLGPVLQARTERRTRHSAATACDHIAYMTALDGVAGWVRGATGNLAAVNDLGFAQGLYDRALADDHYHDFHAWVFVPSSFRLLISDLQAMALIDLHELDFRLTDIFEFLVVLGKQGGGSVPDRSELMRRMRVELMEFPGQVPAG